MVRGEELARILPRLRPQAYSYTRSVPDAEDLLQEVAVRALSAPYVEADRLEGWLRTIMRRLALDQRRAARVRDIFVPLSPALLETIRSAPAQEAAVFSGEFAAARRALADDDQALLNDIEHGLKYREIAQARGLNPMTVGTRLFRLRSRLRAKGFSTTGD